MKKRLSCLLVAVLALSLLAACGGTSKQTGGATGGAQESTEAVDAAEPAADVLAELPASLTDGVVKATPEMYTNVDLSKPYTVYLYLIGDTPQDWDTWSLLIPSLKQ